jgi:Tol biopolymer transport system component
MNEPALAPDGSAVVFTSTREESVDLWMVPLDGNQPAGDPQRLTRQPGSCANPDFSPDGEWIAYHGVIDGQRDIWVMPSTGGTPRVLEEHPASDIQPEWSPDGTRIALSSDRTGSFEIWVGEVEGDRLIGRMRQITDTEGGSSNHSWSPDSTQLVFIELTADSSDVYIVDSEGAGEPRRLTFGTSAMDTEWSPVSGELLVVGLWDERSYHIRAIDPVTGKSKQGSGLGPVSESAVMAGLDVSADGRLIVWAEEEDHGDLWVLERRR